MGKHSKNYILGAKKDLGILRGWFEGFAAAGGKVSSFEDSLRKAQLILSDYAFEQDDKKPEEPKAEEPKVYLAPVMKIWPPGGRVVHRFAGDMSTILSSYKDLNGNVWLFLLRDGVLVPDVYSSTSYSLIPED